MLEPVLASFFLLLIITMVTTTAAIATIMNTALTANSTADTTERGLELARLGLVSG